MMSFHFPLYGYAVSSKRVCSLFEPTPRPPPATLKPAAWASQFHQQSQLWLLSRCSPSGPAEHHHPGPTSLPSLHKVLPSGQAPAHSGLIHQSCGLRHVADARYTSTVMTTGSVFMTLANVTGLQRTAQKHLCPGQQADQCQISLGWQLPSGKMRGCGKAQHSCPSPSRARDTPQVGPNV